MEQNGFGGEFEDKAVCWEFISQCRRITVGRRKIPVKKLFTPSKVAYFLRPKKFVFFPMK